VMASSSCRTFRQSGETSASFSNHDSAKLSRCNHSPVRFKDAAIRWRYFSRIQFGMRILAISRIDIRVCCHATRRHQRISAMASKAGVGSRPFESPIAR